MIKVFIADDHILIREGLKKLFSEESDIEVIGEADNPHDIIDSVNKMNFDVLLLDINLPQKSGLDVLKEIKLIKPDQIVLMLSMHPEERYAVRTLRAGADGYVQKGNDPEELLIAVRKVASGRKYVSSNLAETIAFELDQKSEKAPHELLSDREFQVFRLLAEGKSQTEIGKDLNLGISTINTYRSRVLEKLKLKTNSDLIRYALHNNLID